MLWNYRGLSRSEGKPDPESLMSDGKMIIKYLKEERGVRKIIIHGQSVGGTIACSLAWHFNCDLLPLL